MGRAILDGRTVAPVNDMLPRSRVRPAARRSGCSACRAISDLPGRSRFSGNGVRGGCDRLLRAAKSVPSASTQVALVETFADQAVIAIENVRLFKELEAPQPRCSAESLEQQTATSEILRVISSSPTDLQPVLDAVAENAARLCDAEDVSILEEDGGVFRVVAFRGASRLRDFGAHPSAAARWLAEPCWTDNSSTSMTSGRIGS